MDSRPAVFVLCSLLLVLTSCNTEILRQQEEQIKSQQEEIARQRKEIEDLAAAKKREEQKRLDCNRAFRDFFDKAQTTDDRWQAVSLYREGLSLCPDDDVAHYELGKALSDLGRYAEAEKEFAAAVALNPDFHDARQRLEAMREKR